VELLRTLDRLNHRHPSAEGRPDGGRIGAEAGGGRGPRGRRVMNAAFAAGDRVAVRRAYPPAHVRTPYYIRGKTGVVERVLGPFPNPEELAYGREGLPKQPLYRVRFLLTDV